MFESRLEKIIARKWISDSYENLMQIESKAATSEFFFFSHSRYPRLERTYSKDEQVIIPTVPQSQTNIIPALFIKINIQNHQNPPKLAQAVWWLRSDQSFCLSNTAVVCDFG